MLKKIVIAVIVIAVIGAVGVFIADRTIFAPAQVTTGVPVAPAGSAPLAGSGTLYKIDAAQSEAHYEVSETFFQGNRLNLAIGRTKGVAGDVRVDFANPANSQIIICHVTFPKREATHWSLIGTMIIWKNNSNDGRHF